jgi:hypothetical protein
MNYEGENGFANKIKKFINEDACDGGCFGTTGLPTDASDSQNVISQFFRDKKLRDLFVDLVDPKNESKSISEAARELNLHVLIEGQITGKHLGALVVSYYFLVFSDEIRRLCSDIASVHFEDYENLWTDTKHFWLKSGSKVKRITPYHKVFIKLISSLKSPSKKEIITPEDVNQLAKFILLRANKIAILSDQIRESIFEIHGTVMRKNETHCVPMSDHDLCKTIPQNTEELKGDSNKSDQKANENSKMDIIPASPTNNEQEKMMNHQIPNYNADIDNNESVIDDPLEAYSRVFKVART